MAQINEGLRRVLTRAATYDFLQDLLGVEHVRQTLANEYIRAQPGMSVLDIGCGTGGILAYLPEVAYFGFDLNRRYIDAAERRYRGRGRFLCADVNAAPEEARGPFDRILAIGLLHHLEDSEALGLMSLAKGLLAPQGQLTTFDCCYRSGQPKLARLLISRDRGRNTRHESGYVTLARSSFENVTSYVREDLLRVPYTHVIMRCSNGQLAA